ncbi:MAG: hypothetical protein KDD29_08385, partial [Flavobacteriales bacterium]|nr:hypothetical protein [Flavobacteriales bacterium]
MKTLFSFLLSFIMVANICASDLQANFSYSTFYSPEQGPYLETYLSIVGGSLTYDVNENGKLQGGVEVILIFKQEEKIINFKKYRLMSVEYADSNAVAKNLLDQQRISLPNGE